MCGEEDGLPPGADYGHGIFCLNSDVPLSPCIRRHDNSRWSRMQTPQTTQAHRSYDRDAYNKWTAGYDVTDAALDKLKGSNFEWVVVTNGDNFYEPHFLSFLNGDKVDCS